MAFFQQTTATTAALASAIADSAGASADAEMVARGGRSLNAAFQHFNNFANWEWTLTEAPLQVVTAPFSVTGISATGGGSTIQVASSAHGVLPDDFIQGPMFANNAASRVTATATAAGPIGVLGFAETFNETLISTAGVTGTVTANRDMYPLPSDWKQPYSIRLINSQYTLRPIGRRHYDRSITSEFTPAGTPLYYDIFTIGTKGKIRLLRPPTSTERMQIRYYRRMDPASATADVPAAYEPYLVGWAKWHFLTDKAESENRANTWLTFARDGMGQMLKESTRQPDEDLMFLPGHYSMNVALGPNSVRPFLDEW